MFHASKSLRTLVAVVALAIIPLAAGCWGGGGCADGSCGSHVSPHAW